MMFTKTKSFKVLTALVLTPLLLYANCTLDRFHDRNEVRSFLYSDPTLLSQTTPESNYGTILLEKNETDNFAGTSNSVATRGTYLVFSDDVEGFRKRLLARAAEFDKKGFTILISKPIHTPDDDKLNWIDPSDYLLVLVELQRELRWYEVD